jgi:hypothetical protein
LSLRGVRSTPKQSRATSDCFASLAMTKTG